jgi:hypothetical protein
MRDSARGGEAVKCVSPHRDTWQRTQELESRMLRKRARPVRGGAVRKGSCRDTTCRRREGQSKKRYLACRLLYLKCSLVTGEIRGRILESRFQSRKVDPDESNALRKLGTPTQVTCHGKIHRGEHDHIKLSDLAYLPS